MFVKGINNNPKWLLLGWWKCLSVKFIIFFPFRTMVYEGIPHSLRPYIWMRLGGAMNKRAQSEVTYKQIVRASSNDHLMTSKQVWSLINFNLFTGFPNILMLDSNALSEKDHNELWFMCHELLGMSDFLCRSRRTCWGRWQTMCVSPPSSRRVSPDWGGYSGDWHGSIRT